MLRRPAFVDRFLGRLPDPLSLRFRVPGSIGLVAGAFGLLLALAAVQLDARRSAEVARTRALTLAETAAPWLDGDSHAGVGSDPQKRLSDLGAVLSRLLEASDYDGVVRTLRPRDTTKNELAAQPSAAHPQALEVVLQSGASVVRTDVDYRPEMQPALFDGHSTSVVAHGRVRAYAPVPDSWGTTTAIVCVEGPASAPLWRRIAFALGAALFAGLLVAAALLFARRSAEGLVRQVAALDSAVRTLADGGMSGPIALARRAPSELTALAEGLEALRSRLEGRLTGQAPPPAQESSLPNAQQALLGEPADFDLALLLQQLVEPARKMAQPRGVEVQLVFPDGLPSQLVGHPLVLFRALDALLRNSLRTTRQGRVTLRVSRAGGSSEGGKLRFELADTSDGVAFKEQQELNERLAAAASGDPNALQDPLHVASALAHALGGELSFVSQPGQGSRFGFTVAFAGLPPSAATGFFPASETGLPSRPSALPQRGPGHLGPAISSFTPRPAVRLR